ncbi:MAG: sigma-54 dependent transcriptional regulator [Firmicutes bacterium]|nr:sigma-54 dependent transcriptional regulator [Bacillota bacterium]MCM1401434.1 sigma-54 dependent transcriptional regulator [Bacteroides sp.]MCM1476792.1 sigma-54 dependent transcriptional regulator [Bacteroides sp.]
MPLNIPEITPEVQQAKMRFGIIGNAPALIAAVTRAIQVAPIDLSVLVTGESGTGKEFFPQIIHAFSPRKHARYIAVNCGAIPEGTIDSELFGHEKGSFTGAVSARKGYFEEADGGTIFLDEVAELPLTTQARLLRVLESGEFLKVGSSTVQRTNIRVVAATNVDMVEAVRQGRFREDLFYRLSTVQISVPPLRDRGNDILLLARKFASDFSERYSMPPINIEESAQRALLHYRWPGNVRQLKNVTEQMALFQAGSKIDGSVIKSYLPDSDMDYTPAVSSRSAHTYDQERELLFNMLFRMQEEIDRLHRRLDREETEQSSAAQPQSRPVEVIEVPTSLVKYTAPSENSFPTLKPEATHTAPAMTLEETERETIRRALENNGGRRKDTARELNISERTLYRKIKDYNLE